LASLVAVTVSLPLPLPTSIKASVPPLTLTVSKGRCIVRWNVTRRWCGNGSSRTTRRSELWRSGKKPTFYFGDAAHMRSDHHAGRTWGRKGETPVVSSTGARYRMSLISAVTSRGHMMSPHLHNNLNH
jgi:hypothetical protein